MNNTIFYGFFTTGYRLFLVLLGCCSLLEAQIPLATQGTSYTQDFNTLANSGMSSVVPAGWAFAETGSLANAMYTASDGSFNTGDVYSFGTGTDTERAFGGLLSGSLTPFIGAQFVNQTGSTLRELTISYQGEQWRLGTSGRTDRLDFQYSTNATSLTTGTWTNANQLDFMAPNSTGTVGALNGNLPANNDFISAAIPDITVNNNGTFWIRWSDFNATGADDGLAVDDFSIYGCSGVFICPQNMTVCLNAGIITLPGSPAEGVYSGPGIAGNTFNPVVAGAGTHTITFTYGINNCFQTCEFMITVIACGPLPLMQWIPLSENGSQTGSCTSAWDCDNNTLCFALMYVPSESGTLTSYTTGFHIDCDSGEDPVIDHQSCVMTTGNDNATDLCADPNYLSFYHNFSGVSPASPAVIEGVAVFIHQVCFTIPGSGSLEIIEDQLTDLTVALTLADGTPFNDFPNYAIFDFDSITYCGLLPVKYASFEVTRAGEFTAAIEWATTEEINNAFFEIQRSNDGGKTFITIGTVDATIQPRSINTYSFIDYEARPGMNYYRLKQVDRDDHFSYSPIRNLSFSTTVFSVKAWPSPVTEMLHVYINHADVAGKIHLVDMSGRTVATQLFDAGDSSHDLFIDGVAPGVYSLLVQSGSSFHNEKIVVFR